MEARAAPVTMPENVTAWCVWVECFNRADAQLRIPAPPAMGGVAAVWMCAGHVKLWQQYSASGLIWVNYAWGRSPIIGEGRLLSPSRPAR